MFDSETLSLLPKVLPHLTFIAIAAGVIGWTIRGPGKSKTAKPSPAVQAPARDRSKNLEASLEKAKASHKAAKTELESLQSSSVAKATFDATAAELESARKAVETERQRAASLDADLKKSQDTIRNLNARANEESRAQKDRGFALENELSKAREQLAILQDRPDDTADLHTEIARLKESVATTTRFAGESRKREAVALEALAKRSAEPAPPAKEIAPREESDRVTAAKAEVARLNTLNANREFAAPPTQLELLDPAATADTI